MHARLHVWIFFCIFVHFLYEKNSDPVKTLLKVG